VGGQARQSLFGRINFWLAGGFGVLYALYTVAGDWWPSWMGQRIFQMADGAGGIPGLATGLVLLAAVPAAFNTACGIRPPRIAAGAGIATADRAAARDTGGAATAAWRRGRAILASPCSSGPPP